MKKVYVSEFALENAFDLGLAIAEVNSTALDLVRAKSRIVASFHARNIRLAAVKAEKAASLLARCIEQDEKDDQTPPTASD